MAIKDRIMPKLPYAGIPAIMAAMLILNISGMDTLTIIRYELALILGYIAAITDIKTKRIPNSFVIAMFGVWILITVPNLFLNTETAVWWLKESAYGAAAGGGLFLLVYIISRKGLGGGDVKFMTCVGLYFGFSGTMAIMLCGTILAALTGLGLIIFKKISRKDMIPLVPFLYIGILTVTFLGNI